jgi:hypothetical protein
MASQYDREAGGGTAQCANAAKVIDGGTRHRREQAPPGQDDGQPIAGRGELSGQRLHCRANVDEVGEPRAKTLAGELAHAGGIRVDADDEPVSLGTRPLEG